MAVRFIRTCQACGHEQESRDPETMVHKGDSEGYRNTLCRHCKSEALDYGSWRETDPKINDNQSSS
jgi:hypothetical protein